MIMESNIIEAVSAMDVITAVILQRSVICLQPTIIPRMRHRGDARNFFPDDTWGKVYSFLLPLLLLLLFLLPLPPLLSFVLFCLVYLLTHPVFCSPYTAAAVTVCVLVGCCCCCCCGSPLLLSLHIVVFRSHFSFCPFVCHYRCCHHCCCMVDLLID